MSNWIARGLRRGILTTRYPHAADAMPPRYRGAAEIIAGAPVSSLAAGAEACLSRAILTDGHGPQLLMSRCFQCGACTRVAPDAFVLSPRFDVAIVDGHVADVRAQLAARVRRLGRSIMIRHVDAGSDASCEQEISALFNPFYDVNRLGLFLTATPRHADVLLVSGVVTHAMAEPLLRAFQAMPNPRVVVAVGTAASSGSIFSGPDIAGPAERIVPVDVAIPGAPPPPLSIIHGLWVALGKTEARYREYRT
ncbi:MAG: NADH:ubiquinone oxidoreductase [Candidatus Eremiobacteraeota bacterium]|nr:NADH:ubiquinone oxidoreductase [Candidatus Eremiobacteraeota bacterium]MBC5821402.1 NADH:ubiquinone oxidoreductase [Candidatus Eremiobacteraeota bacterium]